MTGFELVPPPSWLVLIHHLPPKPDYLRVKVRRRLERLGALLVKNSVYVLPLNDETLEDFHWLAAEIAADGGEATICAAAFLSGITDDDLAAAFPQPRKGVVPATEQTDAASSRTDTLQGRTWVTRAGVFVDRIASAWLIRRFIDAHARFAFVTTTRHRPGPGEVRFDMFDAEFTHEGDRCTFEVLIARFALSDPALTALAEIVHDIDVKDEKFGRAEALGIAAVLQGIAATTTDDVARLERGAALFDGLYATLAASSRA